MNSGSWWWTERLGVLQFMGSQSQTRLSDWTELRDQWCRAFSHVLISHSHISALYRKVYAECFTIFKWGNLSLKLLTSVFHIFLDMSHQIYDLQIFPLILLVVFSLSWWFTLQHNFLILMIPNFFPFVASAFGVMSKRLCLTRNCRLTVCFLSIF